MTKIIAAVDGSDYANSVCKLSAWAAKNLQQKVSLLHAVPTHHEVEVKPDYSGSMTPNLRREVLENLTKEDEAHGKVEQQKAQIILNRAKDQLANLDISDVETINRRGEFVETVVEFAKDVEMIVIGKSGEDEDHDKSPVGSNLEPLARRVQKPILVASINPKEITNFLIAYDGSELSKKALDYIANSTLLAGLDCHLLRLSKVNDESKSDLAKVEEKLKNAGFNVTASIKDVDLVEDEIIKYIKENNITLLTIGAYSHSKVRNFFMGSKTTHLVDNANVPVLMFR